MMKINKILLIVVATAFLPLGANAAVFELVATLTTDAEVPAIVAPAPEARGSAAMVLDSDSGQFSWVIDFKELSSDATAAHFHAAPAGSSGGVVLNLFENSSTSNPDPNDPDSVTFSGIGQSEGIFSGGSTLDAAAVEGLLSSNWYINIHTELNGSGEIRGQVLGGTFSPISPVPLPAAAWLFLSGLTGLVVIKRRKAKIFA